MNKSVKQALSAALEQYAVNSQLDYKPLSERLIKVFELEIGFMDKVTEFDTTFDDYSQFEELREVFFDLLMVNFFTSDAERLEADYLDSKEWEKIEDDTIDRGTELLNLLLYINECYDEKIKPSLEDFLKEFLLVEEDEFQDEYHIYESLIENQQLADSSIQDICENAKILKINEELQDLFVPFLCFFYQTHWSEQTHQEINKYSNNKDFDSALYRLISTFNDK